MEFYRGREGYYIQAKRIVGQTKTFKVLAKTPSLFMPAVYDYQKAYYNTLIGRLQNDNIFIEYMFSLPLTREEIIKIGKSNPKEALRALSEWEKYSTNSKIDLKYIKEKNPFSCCIGDRRTTVLLVYPSGDRASMTFDTSKNPYYLEVFNQLFETAENKHEDVLSEIQSHLQE